jgi:AcrR family transcriptional regulator
MSHWPPRRPEPTNARHVSSAETAGEEAGVVATRPLRVDARRNRDRLLTQAGDAFSERGADVALEEIARRADVGIGTLYRHFPTRAALVEAVYRREVALLCDSADELLRIGPPEAALEQWLQRFVDYVAAKRGMAEALKAVVGQDSELFTDSHRRINESINKLVEAAAAAGVVRGDVEPFDLLRAVSGICLVPNNLEDWRDRAHRLVALLMDGMRYRGGS